MKTLIDNNEFTLSIIGKHEFYSLNRKTSDAKEAFTTRCPNCKSSTLEIEGITEELGYPEIMYGCQDCGCGFSVAKHIVIASG